MKYKKQLFLGIAAITLIANIGTTSVVNAQTSTSPETGELQNNQNNQLTNNYQ